MTGKPTAVGVAGHVSHYVLHLSIRSAAQTVAAFEAVVETAAAADTEFDKY